MCGIAAYICLTPQYVSTSSNQELISYMHQVLTSIYQRGPDAYGMVSDSIDPEYNTSIRGFRRDLRNKSPQQVDQLLMESLQTADPKRAVFNFRGIPTTEAQFSTPGQQLRVCEIQPFVEYDGNRYHYVVHNGTISNDQEFGFEQTLHPFGYDHDIDTMAIARLYADGTNKSGTEVDRLLKGSWAYAMLDPDRLVISRSYLGLYYSVLGIGDCLYLVFSSTQHSLDSYTSPNCEYVVREFPLYSNLELDCRNTVNQIETVGLNLNLVSKWVIDAAQSFVDGEKNQDVAIVLSGGLDSTTVAVWAATRYRNVHLLHFRYGCRAETNEVWSVEKLAHWIKRNRNPNVTIRYIDTDFLKSIGNSSLTDMSLDVSTGDKGAETASEWVPARNFMMVGMVASYCDAHNIGTICLGLNREESGAFKDNCSEFVELLNPVLKFATQSDTQIVCPLENLMKHHIVTLGQELGVPFELTWSCYHASPNGEQCGKCGPCTNTQKAFKMARIENPISYIEV